MVATDVASRGIGMIANTRPSPSFHFFLVHFCPFICAFMRDLNDVLLFMCSRARIHATITLSRATIFILDSSRILGCSQLEECILTVRSVLYR
jgi:hypothetical protein